ncbi:MAG: chemotaxis protein, partial [Deltaproteobacteria bacterium]|nr:chemotaxis protein [Deltaproteobacteria bacterium]
GVGFAVVADEVRNLALRSAAAARNTSDLIANTGVLITKGAHLVKDTENSFIDVKDNAGRVGTLLSEIATASNEQAQGIEQINLAVSEMTGVTERNAETVTYLFDASCVTNQQVRDVKVVIDDLARLIGQQVAAAAGTGEKMGPAKQRAMTGKDIVPAEATF